PLLVISVMLMVSAVRATSLDLRHQDDYIEPTINIEELPDMDPWSSEGIALARFEKEKDAAQQAAELEREAYSVLMNVKKEIRAYVLEQGAKMDEHKLPVRLQQTLEAAQSNLSAAQAKKIELSEQAQKARIAFDQVVADLPLV
ncbi:BCCT family transporter, partial [Vibrio genomosp. F10 str. 9ZD137]